MIPLSEKCKHKSYGNGVKMGKDCILQVHHGDEKE